MTSENKTVFISYRRNVSAFIARAIFQDLRYNGYDVFMDVMSIDSGAFDTAILNQIAARAHFIVILTPGAVERCIKEDGSENQDDWFRREIEHALQLQRNVIPLLVNNFSFQNSELYLTGKLATLARFNAVNIPHDYFEEAMTRLRTRFLKQEVKGSIIEPPSHELQIIREKITEANKQPVPSKAELSSEKYMEQAYSKVKSKDFDGAIADYEQAIQLNPDFPLSYFNRGVLFLNQKKYIDAAILDFNEAIRLDPEMVEAFFARATAFGEKLDWNQAIEDYGQVIRQGTHISEALNNRGEAFFIIGEYKKALLDFEQANKLKHNGFRMAIAGLAITHHALGNPQKANQYWQSLIKRSRKFRDAQWVKKELNWNDKLIEEAKKIIGELQ